MTYLGTIVGPQVIPRYDLRPLLAALLVGSGHSALACSIPRAAWDPARLGRKGRLYELLYETPSVRNRSAA